VTRTTRHAAFLHGPMHPMSPPSDHLLRTLAAVPVSSNILDLGCGHGRHTAPLLRLGFPVHACDARPSAVQAARDGVTDLVGEDTAEQCVRVVPPDGFDVYPDDAFNWIVAFDPTAYAPSGTEWPDLLREIRRLLAPGGWAYVASTGRADPSGDGATDPTLQPTPARLDTYGEEAGLAASVAAERAEEHGQPLVRAIFRYVTEATPR